MKKSLTAALVTADHALRQAERLAWEVGCETVDGVHTLLSDSRGDLYRTVTDARVEIKNALGPFPVGKCLGDMHYGIQQILDRHNLKIVSSARFTFDDEASSDAFIEKLRKASANYGTFYTNKELVVLGYEDGNVEVGYFYDSFGGLMTLRIK